MGRAAFSSGLLCKNAFSQEFAPLKIHNSFPENLSSGDTFRIVDKTDDSFYFEAFLNSDGRLSFNAFLSLPEFGLRSSMRGNILYKKMIQFFDIRNISSIKGTWVDGTNYDHFFKKIDQGYSKEDAAQSTWSGQQAKKYGFSIVESVDIRLEPMTGINSVTVIFRKPPLSNEKLQEVMEQIFSSEN